MAKTQKLVQEVSEIVNKITGVRLALPQAQMVENRTKRRMIQLGITTPDDYLDYLHKHLETETKSLVSLLTTHHTYFFREFAHFEYLEQVALPLLILEKRKSADRVIRVWCAACSRGQEVYSLAMFLSHLIPKMASDFTFEILGTDVDTDSVNIAENGVYLRKEVQEVPLQFLAENWSKGTGEISSFVKAKARIRRHCRFETQNLLELHKIPASSAYDFIFCRNVFIYFEEMQIKEITATLLKHLSPEGYLFLGISESLTGLNLPVTSVSTSVFKHDTTSSRNLARNPLTEQKALDADVKKPAPPRLLKVLCVDDSTVIHTLLKRILAPGSGFEVIGTALNGIEATQRLKELEVDLITLDIHMPGQDGLTFLKTLKGTHHPPVVMISSVTREDADLALQCLDSGASDYVEKPALSNLTERGDEIKLKLRYAFEKKEMFSDPLRLEREFAQVDAAVPTPENKLRIIFASMTDRQAVEAFLSELKGIQPPAIVVMEGAGNGLVALKNKLSATLPKWKATFCEKSSSLDLKTNELVFMDVTTFAKLPRLTLTQNTAILIFGRLTPKCMPIVSQFSEAIILLDDIGGKNIEHPMAKLASDIVSSSSFAYLSTRFFTKGIK
jgi:chemotaxis protein methyltransferase CheR